jgi:NAD(P)-dependent dehydrogenase (short-subunit alcohol dehydrogenase family)
MAIVSTQRTTIEEAAMAAEGEIEQPAIYPSLRDRAVLVTGGAAGIGASIVEHFWRQHARVVFVDIDDARAERLTDRLSETGYHRPSYIRCDLTDIAALRAAFSRAADLLGPIGVLVNNAAHDERHRWQDVTPKYWDERIAVNLRHQFFAIQAVAPAMADAGGGSIVNFGSTSWRIGIGGMPAYVASKAAIEALTRSFARDLGKDRIRVNCVLPGWVMTERQLALWVDDDTEALLKRVQCLPGRLYPPDLARMVLFLAADDSRMVTNQTFVVDAGWI